jgi:hypothetical protein
VIHVTAKWLPELPTVTVSKSHRRLELSAVRAEYILSVLHKSTIRCANQQSIKNDYSILFILKYIITGEQKDRENCDTVFTVETAALFRPMYNTTSNV